MTDLTLVAAAMAFWLGWLACGAFLTYVVPRLEEPT
jgi:hypothetical protein